MAESYTLGDFNKTSIQDILNRQAVWQLVKIYFFVEVWLDTFSELEELNFIFSIPIEFSIDILRVNFSKELFHTIDIRGRGFTWEFNSQIKSHERKSMDWFYYFSPHSLGS